MGKRTLAVIAAVLVTFSAWAAFAGGSQSPTEAESILSAILFGNEMVGAMPVGMRPEIKKAVEVYRKREAAFESPEPPVKEGAEEYSRKKRAGIQRAIFSLFDRPDSLKLATEFTSEIQLFYEWEGSDQAPMDEARSAKAFLEQHPKSPIASYVNLFIGHRESCALSFAGGREGYAPDVGKDASARLEQAKKSSNPLIKLVAKHLHDHGGCYPP